MANWTKCQLVVIALMMVMGVLAVKHREFFYCQEKTQTPMEKLAVWIGVAEKPAPCPGEEELYSMAVEMGLCLLAVLASTVIHVPTALQGTKWLITTLILIMKERLLRIKEIIQNQKNTTRDVSKETRPRPINYHIFQNAYRQRKLVMLLRECDGDEEILLYNSEMKTVKRLA